MRKSSKASKQQESDFELLRGGKLAESAVQRHFADVKKKLAAEIKEEAVIQQQAAKYFSQIDTPNNGGDSPKVAQAISGLRGITERLAKRKLAAPRKVNVPPITVWGTYTL